MYDDQDDSLEALRPAQPPPGLNDGSPPSRRAYVAAFICPEVQRIGREVGFPLAVIAATSDPERHAARLSATRHAGWSPRTYADWCMPFDDGLALPEHLVYRQFHFDRRWLGRSPLPAGVTLSAGSLAVDLPIGACAGDLSAVLHAGMIESSYDRVARRPGRVRQRYSSNRPSIVAPRYALTTPGDIERVVAVDDLFAFRPADLRFLANAVACALDALTITFAITHVREEPGLAVEDAHR